MNIQITVDLEIEINDNRLTDTEIEAACVQAIKNAVKQAEGDGFNHEYEAEMSIFVADVTLGETNDTLIDALKDTEGNVTAHNGVLTFPDGSQYTLPNDDGMNQAIDEAEKQDTQQSICVQWGNAQTRSEVYNQFNKGAEYTFATKPELDAFILALNEHDGWMESTVIEINGIEQ